MCSRSMGARGGCDTSGCSGKLIASVSFRLSKLDRICATCGELSVATKVSGNQFVRIQIFEVD